MSARIEIKDDGYSVVIKPKGKWQVRLFVNDTDSITQKTIAAIRQQQADIDNLRSLLESQIETIGRIDHERIKAFDELDQLRAENSELRARQDTVSNMRDMRDKLDQANDELAELRAELSDIKQEVSRAGYL